jgi:VanZ family protein
MESRSRILQWLVTSWGSWLPPFIWMGVIFLLSSRPDLPSLPFGTPNLQNIVGHLFEYGVLAYLLARAFNRLSSVGHAHLWAMALVMVYAASDEWHQTFVPGRHGDLLDWLVDVTAALLVLSLRHWAMQRQGHPGWPPAPTESESPRTTGAAPR